MAATIDELKELAMLARESGDDALEEQALTKIIEMQSSAEATAQPKITPTPIAERATSPYGSMAEFVSAQRGAPVDSRIPQAGNLANEAAAGAARPIAAMIDFSGIDRVNDVLRGMGIESQIPTAGAQIPAQGTFDPSGLGKIAGAIGTGATTGGIAGGALRGAASMLNPQSLSTGAQVLRNVAATTPAADVITGGMSGAGSVPGGAIGEAVGGETGRQIGELVGGIAGALPYAATKLTAVRERFDPKGFMTDVDGMPKPEFERALIKRGLDVGALIDDAGSLPVIRSTKSADDVVDDIIKQQLVTGKRTDALYQYKVEGGRVVDDVLGKEAKRQGFKEGDIVAAKQANLATKNAMRRQLTMMQAIKADSSKALEFRPADVAGDALINRFRYVRGEADKLRIELDRIAKSQLEDTVGGRKLTGNVPGLKGVEINSAKVEESFFNALDKLNLKLPDGMLPNEAFKLKDIFVGSQISKDRTSQRFIKDVADLLAEPGHADALRAHNLKRQLDSLIDFNKKAKGGLSDAGRNVAKQMRAALNDVIREVSPRYAKVNDQLSMSLNAMNDFEKAMGGKIDVFAENADQAVGQELRKMLSNYNSRQSINNSTIELDRAASELGGSFDTSYKDLIQFANTLDTRFGAAAEGSLKGVIDRASSLDQLRPSELVKDYAAQKTIGKIKQLQGINDREAFKTMHKILKEGPQ